MQRPVLSNVSNNREMISTFLGYNHRVVQQAGEFFNTENITVDAYPMLSNRAPVNRYKYPEFDKTEMYTLFTVRPDGTNVLNNYSLAEPDWEKIIAEADDLAYILGAGNITVTLNVQFKLEYKVKFNNTMKERAEIWLYTPGNRPSGLITTEPSVRLDRFSFLPVSTKGVDEFEISRESGGAYIGSEYIDLRTQSFVPVVTNGIFGISIIINSSYTMSRKVSSSQKSDDEAHSLYMDLVTIAKQDAANIESNLQNATLMERPGSITVIEKAASGKNVGCLIKNQQITSVFNDVLYYAGKRYGLDLNTQDFAAVDGKLQLLNFGTKILIFPYGLCFDTEEPDKGVLPLAFKATASENLVCTMCTEDGTLHTRLYCGANKPAGAAVGTYVVRSNGDLRTVDEHGALVLLCAAANWKRQDKDPGVSNYDYWLDTTGTTGSGLKKYSQGTLYRKEDGAWVAEDNVLFSNTWFYTFWLDTTNAEAPVYKSYSSTADAWIAIPVTYVHIDTTEIKDSVLQSVKAGDTVKLSPDDAFTTEWVNVHSTADDGSWIIVKGMLRGPVASYSRPTTIEKVLPEFDFVTVAQNRVWGCKYGYDSASKHINQIYASKLGDPTNWYCFENTASDSYALSLGDDEPFTGAVSLNDMPYFFKQNKIYGIYGGYPAAYQRIAIEERGVENDCSGSLAVLNGAVFYKSLDGVCVFDGSTVTNISAALGNTRYTEANAGSSLGKYYISMKNETDGGYETFVYDLNTSLWVRLNGTRYLHFITDYTGSVYAMDPDCIFHELGRHNETALSGLELYQTEDKVEWYAETGAIDFSYPDKKIVSRINLRAKIALGAVLKAFIQYDSSGQWIQMGVLTGNGTPKTEVLNIVPQACDHYALRLEGCGDVRVISIANTMTLGSDL